MTEQNELRAELRRKSRIELHRLVTARDTPEATRKMAQDILWEMGKSHCYLGYCATQGCVLRGWQA
ncbi:MAG: hypothetical protein MUO99_07100 [Dehalococcoidales bacterium]|nr:hypothetical protein [Dehalococcoidales bacterium]